MLSFSTNILLPAGRFFKRFFSKNIPTFLFILNKGVPLPPQILK
jgi:hypothetical protein